MVCPFGSVNRLYTFLDRFFNATGDEHKAFLERMHFMSAGSTDSWDEPILDGNLWKTDQWKASDLADCRLPWEHLRSIDGEQSSGS